MGSCYHVSTAWKVSKYGVISGPYFPVFSPNRTEVTPYLDTFHLVDVFCKERARLKAEFWPSLHIVRNVRFILPFSPRTMSMRT